MATLKQEEEEGEGEDSAGPPLERVVHRDLKPANILINSLGRAKICDFGLAREHTDTSVYTDHRGAGTLRYLAPELALDKTSSSLTDKADIYALGVLLWEMATGLVPWQGCSESQILTKVQQGLRPALIQRHTTQAAAGGSPSSPSHGESLFERLPKLATVVQACWQQQAYRRPNAATVRKHLEALLALSSSAR